MKDNKIKFLEDFEYMIYMAELKALSNFSLKQPLNNKQFKRMMELKEKCFK